MYSIDLSKIYWLDALVVVNVSYAFVVVSLFAYNLIKGHNRTIVAKTSKKSPESLKSSSRCVASYMTLVLIASIVTIAVQSNLFNSFTHLNTLFGVNVNLALIIFILMSWSFFLMVSSSDKGIKFSKLIVVFFFELSILLIICINSYFILIIIIEFMSFLVLTLISSLENLNNNITVTYIWVTALSTLFMIVAIIMSLLSASTAANIFAYLFLSIKIGALPFGFWVKDFYEKTNLEFFLIYVSSFYLIMIFISVMIVLPIITPSTYLGLVLKLLTLISSIVSVSLVRNNLNIKSIIAVSTWCTAAIIIILVF